MALIRTALIQWPARRPGLTLICALVLTLAGVFAAIDLPFLTARKALLPQTEPTLVRLERYLAEFGAASELTVVLHGAERAERNAFAQALAERLAARPEVGSVVWRVEPAFFFERAWLFMPPEALSAVEAAVGPVANAVSTEAARVLSQAALSLKLVQLMGPPDPPPEARVRALPAAQALVEGWKAAALARQEAIDWAPVLSAAGADPLIDGTFSSRDGSLTFMFVRASNPSEAFEIIGPFVEAVRAEADALSAAQASSPEVGLTGVPMVVYEEFTTLTSDVPRVATTAAILIVALILLALRSIPRAAVIFLPMLMGVAWNMGLAWLFVGHLTLLTSAFTAILFGLGVDYGIFLSARVIEGAGRHPDDPERVIQEAVAGSIRPLLVAGGATALICATLIPASFKGFSELGVIAGSGVAMVLLATLVVQPALLRLPLKPGWGWLNPVLGLGGPVQRRGAGDQPASVSSASTPRRRRAALLMVPVSLLGALGVYAAFIQRFDYDMLSLLPAESEAAYWQRRMVKESDYQSEVVIFTAPDLPTALALEARARELPSLIRVQGPGDLLPADAAARAEQAQRVGRALSQGALAQQVSALAADLRRQAHAEADGPIGLSPVISSVADWLATAPVDAASGQPAGLVGALRALNGLLKAPDTRRATIAVLAGLVEQASAAVASAEQWTAARPLGSADLPEGLRQRFFGKEGSVAFYGFPAGSVYEPEPLARLNQEVLALAPEATGFPINHAAFSRILVEDFVQSSLLALLVAVLWIAITLRRWRSVVIAATPLLLGGAWMMGLLWLVNVPFNFANLAALPLVMGLAVDYGVWFAEQAHQRPELSGWGVTRVAGRPILLAAATTLMGLGAIMSGAYQGMVSMGQAITAGLLACVAAALLVSPLLVDALRRPEVESTDP